jgi:hypothetical protein
MLTGNQWSVILLLFAGLVVGLLPTAHRKWRERISRNWLTTTAHFLSGRIDEEYGPQGEGPGLRLRAKYSYSVGTFRFVGEYSESVQSLEEGTQLLRSLEAGPLLVRYHPSCPDDSVMSPYRDVS